MNRWDKLKKLLGIRDFPASSANAEARENVTPAKAAPGEQPTTSGEKEPVVYPATPVIRTEPELVRSLTTHPDPEVRRLVLRCDTLLGLADAELAAEYGYGHLPLFVIDAVFSINARYAAE